MQTYLIADTHFNCPKLVRNTRRWTTPEAHDQVVLEAINSTVTRHDRLFILGDFCKGKPHKWRQQIKCRNIWFIVGNHDKPITAYRNCFGLDRVLDTKLLKFRDGDETSLIWLSHYPNVHYPQSHYGAYHAYGHVHSQKEAELDSWMPQRRSMDVGVDQLVKLFGNPSPINAYQFTDRLRGRTGHGIIKREDRWKQRDFG